MLFKITSRLNHLNLGVISQIAGLFAIVFVLELSTPPNYVFGYLYTGPILLANARLGAQSTLQVTLIAVILTLANLWLPGGQMIEASTIANRAIASMALIVTGLLSERIRRKEDAIVQQQAKLRAQEQLAQLREDFASTLTHDLKTPLLGAIETIRAFQKEQFGAIFPTQRKVLETMKRSHETSLKLVETLLDIYRNDTEGLKLEIAPIDLTVLAEEVAGTLTELATSRQVYLSVTHGASDFRRSLWVNGDALQLQRVFTNLLINAINHSRRGERVEVVLDPQPSFQTVKISDTGAGIRSTEFSYLFERFYQGHSDRQAKGSGLGLYLSRQIIEAHGGTIWAENRIPTGALFGFKLPVYPFQPPDIMVTTVLLCPDMPISPLRILLVEDDELFRLGLQVRLQQEIGLEVTAEAEDGETAIDLANRQPFDVVLLDIGLPGVGGLEACRQIKQQHPDLPVLILTSRSQQSLITRLIEVGAQGYCLKGIAAEVLVLALKSVAAGASWWDSTATKEIRSAIEAPPPSQNIAPEKGTNPLTQREQEILTLMAVGKSNQEIAEALYIAPGTVRVHVHAILHKLEARDRTQAVILAIQKRLISANETENKPL